MTPPLSYLEFVAAFVAAPALVLFALGAGIDRERRPSALAGVAVMLVVALSYTTPWDNLLIAEGVWSYGVDTVAFRVWNAPIEEYAFIALQTVLAALWLYRRPLPREGRSADGDGGRRVLPDGAGTVAEEPLADADPPGTAEATHGTGETRTWRALPNLVGAGGWTTVAVLGALSLSGETLYLGAILAWAGPVLALQWAVGGRYLLSVRRHLAWAVVPPVAYLCTVDRLAIEWGLWTIAPAHSTGVAVLGLPVEEGAFFLLTTLMVAQGLVLFHWVIETRPRWAVRLGRALDRRPG